MSKIGFSSQFLNLQIALSKVFGLPVVVKDPSESLTCQLYLIPTAFKIKTSTELTIEAEIQLMGDCKNLPVGYLAYQAYINTQYGKQLQFLESLIEEEVLAIDKFGVTRSSMSILWVDDVNITITNNPLNEVIT